MSVNESHPAVFWKEKECFANEAVAPDWIRDAFGLLGSVFISTWPLCDSQHIEACHAHQKELKDFTRRSRMNHSRPWGVDESFEQEHEQVVFGDLQEVVSLFNPCRAQLIVRVWSAKKKYPWDTDRTLFEWTIFNANPPFDVKTGRPGMDSVDTWAYALIDVKNQCPQLESWYMGKSCVHTARFVQGLLKVGFPLWDELKPLVSQHEVLECSLLQRDLARRAQRHLDQRHLDQRHLDQRHLDSRLSGICA